jgi:ABC-type branched-subunit amino acid transport system substrate-binding protein
MKKLAIAILTIAILAALLTGGCAKPSPAPKPAPTKTLDIGIATPLTGTFAFLGTMIRNGILIAIDDQNQQGGITIGTQNYTLNAIVRDTKMDILVGKSVAEELV